MKNKPTPEELALWNEVFLPLLSDKKGLNKAKLIKFLCNHHRAVQEVIRVYHHVTNGTITDITTPASKVIEVITDLDNKNLEGILKDEKEKWLHESVEHADDAYLVKMVAKLNQNQASFEVVIPPADKYNIVWDGNINQLLVRPNKSLPVEWQYTAAGACARLMQDPTQKELMVTR
jgi:hypothetical protein